MFIFKVTSSSSSYEIWHSRYAKVFACAITVLSVTIWLLIRIPPSNPIILDFREHSIFNPNSFVMLCIVHKTNSMEQNPPWKSNRHSASQEIPRVLCNRDHKRPSLVPILSQMQPVHTFSSYPLRSILISPAPQRLLRFHVLSLIYIFLCLDCSKDSNSEIFKNY
jgi:hypothetical protein